MKTIFYYIFLFIFISTLNLSQTLASSTKTSDLFKTLILDTHSLNNDLTQVEFLILVSRLLKNTNDLAPHQFISPLKNVPKWAESEINDVQNKFGQLEPYYFESFNPIQTISKQTIAKFLMAYIDPYTYPKDSNQKINFNVSFYSDQAGYKFLVENAVIPNTSRDNLSKSEVAKALIKAHKLRLKPNKMNAISSNASSATNQPNSKTPFMNNPLLDLTSESVIEGNLGISNLYIWRGMSQTNNIGNPAIFGGLDTSILDNISVGTWVSNVSFADQTSYEWDIYGSLSYEFPTFPDISYELGAIYYAYPNTTSGNSIDFSEGFLGISFQDFKLQHHVLLTGPGQATIADDTYTSIYYSRELLEEIQFISSAGYYRGSVNVSGSQWDYMAGLQKKGLTFATIGTNKTSQKPSIIIKYETQIF